MVIFSQPEPFSAGLGAAKPPLRAVAPLTSAEWSCYVTKLCSERHNTCLLAPDKDPMINQSTDTTKVPLSESVRFVEVTDRNVGEGLPTGSEMTQRLLCQGPPQRG